MKNISLSLFLMISVFMLEPSFVLAQKYTTKDSGAREKIDAPIAGQANKKKGEASAMKCNQNDMAAIKRFDVTARKKKNDLEELYAGKGEVRTPDDATKFSKEHDKIMEFYRSEEFELMKEVYKMCGQEMPMMKTEQPFWIYGSENKSMNVM